jgi:hypothetical protein
MKKYFTLLFYLFFLSLTEGRASLNEELDIKPTYQQYLNYFEENKKLFETTRTKIDLYIKLTKQNSLSETTQKNVRSYLGTISPDASYLRKLEDISSFVLSLTNMSCFYGEQIGKMLLVLSSEAIPGNAFRVYCHKVKALRNLKDKKNSLPFQEIGLVKDIDQLYESLEKIKRFFSKNEHYLLNFLSIQRINKLPVDDYDVRLSLSAIVSSQIKDIQNILALSNKINPDKFFINERYKNRVKQELFYIKSGAQQSLSQKKIKLGLDLQKLSQLNLAKESETFQIPSGLFQNWQRIEQAYNVIFNILNLEFVYEGQTITLTPAEREKNHQIYLQMIQSDPSEKVIQHKTKNKKKHNKQENLSFKQEQSSEIEKEFVKTTTSSDPLEENTKEALFNPLDNSQPLIMEHNNTKEGKLSELAQETEVDQCKRLLQEIMKSTANQEGENYFIWEKAHSLFKNLSNHEYLLPEIQQTTSQLSIRVAEMKKDSVLPLKLTISQIFLKEKDKEDYLFIMKTPIRYLKNALRFGVVRRFIEGIGGNIDVGRAGSRIGIKLNNLTTTIHLHDSTNGILDGGRIMSIRDFITKAGVILKTEE